MKRLNIILFLALCLGGNVHAVDKLEVEGLFPGKAVLMIDGNRHVLGIGETSPEGVRVIAADSKSAILEVDGKQEQYFLGNTITTEYTRRPSVKEQIMADGQGMYLAYGSINGHSVRFLVDTGASIIAINSNAAKRMGIQYRLDGKPTTANTASGVAKAWEVKLKSVKVGQLKQRNVPALVIDGPHPLNVLLGMTFLERLKVQKENGTMILEQKR